MKLKSGLLLCAWLVSQGAVAAPGSERSQSIVGGVEASVGEFPFIVSLHGRSGHYCGGSLIADDWVLTAAHCMEGESAVKVVIGLHDQREPGNAEAIQSKRIIVHPKYNSSKVDYDYALIQLQKSSSYPPVALSNVDLPGKAEILSTVAGWGLTKETGGTLPRRLQKVDVPLVSRATCSKGYPGQITERMICAGYEEGGKDSCQGDSGGPLVVTHRGEQILVGIVSWGEGCARAKKYGVYANVSNAISWIRGHVQ